MLIHRNQKGVVIEGYYESSNILQSEYDVETKDLTITFKNGGKYTYNGVTMTDFTRFEEADSQGKELNARIKTKYNFVKVGTVETKPLLEEIDQIKRQEIMNMEAVMIQLMESIKEYYDANECLPESVTYSLYKSFDPYYEKKGKIVL